MKYLFKGRIEEAKDNSLMWNYRIGIPEDIMNNFMDTDKRVICSVNDSTPIHCALLSSGNSSYYIMLNAAFRKQWNLIAGDNVEVALEKDMSKYGIFAPEFFEELCFQDPEGDAYFHKLTPGKQRSLLHVIGKVKSESKQVEKALIIFDYLKQAKGELDFKELNIAFKNSRFKK